MIPGKLSRLGIASVLAAVMYTGLPASQQDDLPDWLVCRLPAPSSDSKMMPAGGGGITLRVAPGHMLEIPGGSLSPGARVTLTVLEETKPGVDIEIAAIESTSNSQTLLKPATLSITYRDCEPKGNPAHYRIHRRVPGQDRWIAVGGRPAREERTISAKLPSFSTYSLAAN
jgi:hypothetical protein